MRATFNEETELFTLDVKGKPQFAAIHAGFGYADPTQSKGEEAFDHWYCVTGKDVAGQFVCLAEGRGPLHEVASELCSHKDSLLLRHIYHDNRNPGLIQELYRHDGLCSYERKGKDRFKRPVYVHESGFWPNFVAYDHWTACPVPVPQEIATVQAALEIVATVQRQERLRVRDECRKVNWLLRQPVDDQIKHPLMQALGYPILMMEHDRFHGGFLREAKHDPAYPNYIRRK
jgi:hypothetical protein